MTSTKNGLGLVPRPYEASTEDENWFPADPQELIEELDTMPIERSVSSMLIWYRSGDMWKVTLSSHYFAQHRYQSWIEGMVGELFSGVERRQVSVIDPLTKYGEPAIRRILSLLSDSVVRPAIIEIIVGMDLHVLPRVLRALNKESWETRLNLIRSYVLRKPEAAFEVMVKVLYNAGSEVSRLYTPRKLSMSLLSAEQEGVATKGSVRSLYVISQAGGFQ